MTNEQLYIAIGVPMIAIIASMIISLVTISGIRDDMRQLRSEFGILRAEIRADINAIRQEVRGDIQTLTGKVLELMGKVE